MLGKSVPEYIFIRISIWLLRLVAPASILYLLASAFAREFILSKWIALLAAPEAAFYLCFYLPRSRTMQRVVPVTEPPLTRSERQALFNRCATCLPDSSYPLGWFLSKDVRRDNVVEWLLWALFSTTLESAVMQEEWPEWNTEIAGYVETIEKLVHHKFEPGRNAKTRSMRIAFDRVLMCHRPLIWYAIVGLVDIYTATSLFHLGFKHYTTQRWFRAFPFRPFSFFSRRAATEHFPYWYRPHTSTTKKPLVFIHGIGIGLYPYVALFKDLTSLDPSVGILLIEILPISMHITCDPTPSRSATLKAIETTMDQLGIEEATLAGHSFGTVISSWVLRSRGKGTGEPSPPAPLLPLHTQRSLSSETTPLLTPRTDSSKGKELASRFTSIVLVDPIPILLHLPDVAYNFLYREPTTANEWQLWYFASRDADVARMLGRYFLWRDCVLWRDDLLAAEDSSVWPGRVAVILSGSDQIVASELVWKYLTKSELTSDTGVASLPQEVAPGRDTAPSSKLFRHWVSPSHNSQDARTERTSPPGLQVLFYPGLDHATVFDTKERREGLLEILEDFSRL